MKATSPSDQPQRCECGKVLPVAQAQHVYRCACGRLWLRADCSEVCEPWREY
ncbi:MAG: hypothetical protein HY231_08145 [Acidobacteria bacterium]|nr:hypothetical protein [Acidobacteriota bacterium]